MSTKLHIERICLNVLLWKMLITGIISDKLDCQNICNYKGTESSCYENCAEYFQSCSSCSCIDFCNYYTDKDECTEHCFQKQNHFRLHRQNQVSLGFEMCLDSCESDTYYPTSYNCCQRYCTLFYNTTFSVSAYYNYGYYECYQGNRENFYCKEKNRYCTCAEYCYEMMSIDELPFCCFEYCNATAKGSYNYKEYQSSQGQCKADRDPSANNPFKCLKTGKCSCENACQYFGLGKCCYIFCEVNKYTYSAYELLDYHFKECDYVEEYNCVDVGNCTCTDACDHFGKSECCHDYCDKVIEMNTNDLIGNYNCKSLDIEMKLWENCQIHGNELCDYYDWIFCCLNICDNFNTEDYCTNIVISSNTIYTDNTYSSSENNLTEEIVEHTQNNLDDKDEEDSSKEAEVKENGTKEEIVEEDGTKEEIVEEDGVKEEIVEDSAKEEIVEDGAKEEIGEDGTKEEILEEDGAKEAEMVKGNQEESSAIRCIESISLVIFLAGIVKIRI